jgi:hypothetical protein
VYSPGMRTLAPPPDAVVDPAVLRVGSYRGGLPPIDPTPLGRGPIFRLAHEKSWVYVAVAAGDLLVAAAVVQLGYAANAFAFVFDRAAGRMLADRSSLGTSRAATVGKTGGAGCIGKYRGSGFHIALERGVHETEYHLDINVPDLRVSARLATEGVPPAIGAVALLPGGPGLFNATEKHVLLPATVEVHAGGRRHAPEGGFGGVDFSFGWLPRRTAWRWAFALGRTRAGERVGLNLVQGFMGAAECAVWVEDELIPLSEGVVDFDQDRPLSPWHVRTVDGEVDLRFEPGAVHEEKRDLVLVASSFIQPAGSFSGTIRVPGRPPLELDGVLGVVEDQRVTW